VGIQEGLVVPDEFSAIVAMVLVSTLVTPPILRGLFAQEKQKAQKKALAAGQPGAPAKSPDEEII
jgi:hypothetical protein